MLEHSVWVGILGGFLYAHLCACTMDRNYTKVPVDKYKK